METDKPKRGRGRPRKRKDDSTTADTLITSVKKNTKKGRGRPKKCSSGGKTPVIKTTRLKKTVPLMKTTGLKRTVPLMKTSASRAQNKKTKQKHIPEITKPTSSEERNMLIKKYGVSPFSEQNDGLPEIKDCNPDLCVSCTNKKVTNFCFMNPKYKYSPINIDNVSPDEITALVNHIKDSFWYKKLVKHPTKKVSEEMYVKIGDLNKPVTANTFLKKIGKDRYSNTTFSNWYYDEEADELICKKVNTNDTYLLSPVFKKTDDSIQKDSLRLQSTHFFFQNHPLYNSNGFRNTMEKINKRILEYAQSFDPDFKATVSSILVSVPGDEEQSLHMDDPRPGKKRDDMLSSIISLTPGSRLQVAKNYNYSAKKKSAKDIIHFAPGSGVIMHGTTIHGGCDYSDLNIRIHHYILKERNGPVWDTFSNDTRELKVYCRYCNTHFLDDNAQGRYNMKRHEKTCASKNKLNFVDRENENEKNDHGMEVDAYPKNGKLRDDNHHEEKVEDDEYKSEESGMEVDAFPKNGKLRDDNHHEEKVEDDEYKSEESEDDYEEESQDEDYMDQQLSNDSDGYEGFDNKEIEVAMEESKMESIQKNLLQDMYASHAEFVRKHPEKQPNAKPPEEKQPNYKHPEENPKKRSSENSEKTMMNVAVPTKKVKANNASTETTITDTENNKKNASVATPRASTETTITDIENNQKFASVASPRASTETTIASTPRGYQQRRVIERLGTPHRNETEIEKAQRESLLKSLCMMQGLAEKSKVQDGHELKMTAIACLKAMDQKGMLPSGIYDHKKTADNVWDWILLKYEPEKVCILFKKLFVELDKIVEESGDEFDPVMKDLDKPLIMDLDLTWDHFCISLLHRVKKEDEIIINDIMSYLERNGMFDDDWKKFDFEKSTQKILGQMCHTGKQPVNITKKRMDLRDALLKMVNEKHQMTYWEKDLSILEEYSNLSFAFIKSCMVPSGDLWEDYHYKYMKRELDLKLHDNIPERELRGMCENLGSYVRDTFSGAVYDYDKTGCYIFFKMLPDILWLYEGCYWFNVMADLQDAFFDLKEQQWSASWFERPILKDFKVKIKHLKESRLPRREQDQTEQERFTFVNDESFKEDVEENIELIEMKKSAAKNK